MSQEQVAFLAERRLVKRRLVMEEYNARFGTNLTLNAIQMAMRRYGLGLPEWVMEQRGRHGFGGKPWRGPGHEFTGPDGYVRICVEDSNGYVKWVMKQRHLWEKANGTLKNGHRLVCVDGDKSNCDPSNWRAIPHGAVADLTFRSPAPQENAELRETMIIMAQVKHAARSAKKRAKNNCKEM